MILGCIGDDFTGSSDLANTLARGGMRCVQYSGVPSSDAAPDVEAGVVALKSRTIPAQEAVRLSLDALEWLTRQGCRQFFFKYCSTFDSTDRGNIGPVAEALADALGNAPRDVSGAGPVIVCPAFPGTGRTVYQGHLFVGDRLLSESGMQDHPLTPMRDPDLRRVLGRQASGTVGQVLHETVRAGPEAIAEELARQAVLGHRLVVVDAVRDEELFAIGAAARGLPLVTGGSGVALGLPANFAGEGLLASSEAEWEGVAGRAAALAGSVSDATRKQVASHIAAGQPALELQVDAVMAGQVTAEQLADWALAQERLPLIYSSADPESVSAYQDRYGRDRVAQALEKVFADTAARLVALGVSRIVCAGGETSGAVVGGLGTDALEIGPEIDPGVPALKAPGRKLALALKSGNFGADDFFVKAARVLEAGA